MFKKGDRVVRVGGRVGTVEFDQRVDDYRILVAFDDRPQREVIAFVGAIECQLACRNCDGQGVIPAENPEPDWAEDCCPVCGGRGVEGIKIVGARKLTDCPVPF